MVKVNIDTLIAADLLEAVSKQLRTGRVGARQDALDCGMPVEYANGVEDGLSVASDVILQLSQALRKKDES
jgi:hypothetical protein